MNWIIFRMWCLYWWKLIKRKRNRLYNSLVLQSRPGICTWPCVYGHCQLVLLQHTILKLEQFQFVPHLPYYPFIFLLVPHFHTLKTAEKKGHIHCQNVYIYIYIVHEVRLSSRIKWSTEIVGTISSVHFVSCLDSLEHTCVTSVFSSFSLSTFVTSCYCRISGWCEDSDSLFENGGGSGGLVATIVCHFGQWWALEQGP